MALLGLSGCYLGHLAHGQARLLAARQPIEQVLEDPALPAPTRRQLELVSDVRAYAAGLGLDVDSQYTSYTPWEGDRLITAVVATEPGQVVAAAFRFPIVGAVPYKGFFDEARAEAEADGLRARGLDVCLVPVPAYSTLGWFSDPVTGPMLRYGDGPLVEMLIHELVHATVYVESEADFNEGVATFIGQEGALRFFSERAGPDAPETQRERERIRDDRAVAQALSDARSRVEELYASKGAEPVEGQVEAEAEAQFEASDAARAALETRARSELAALPLTTRDPADTAANALLNDACLALASTYEADLGEYARRLGELGGELPAFVASVLDAADQASPRSALLGHEPATSAKP